ncbi:Putative thiamine biosynthesis protein HI_0357 [Delftia tsuruhatensis]|uniref:ABC transporter substrate-binding protein n=1 Tax=Delftia tsuruhatensis TaxID=180282 RepID=UPI001E792711|nr:ABC transporter substrate-binding protein [Delftia tsuruhatensis]CAB5713227.1 Putative thiamine biosynthesis protein HI_0357 [Delftia tsuruhatensis]CAC9691960.1 Putative thiamine biosynthesis protein HI_0357 [Delftia tsuruhatensis]
MHSPLTRRAAGLALAGLGLALSAPATAQPLEKIKVRMDWTPWGVQAAMHLAQHKGWFKAAGLDVQLEDGNGSVTTVQIVGGGDQFDVGHAALASMMIARDKGLPVKAIAVFARLSDIGLLVPRDGGIRGPGDLRGRKVAYTAGSLEAPFIDAFLAAGGLKRSDLELVNIDAAGKAASYAAGRADAAFSTIPFFLPVVSQTRPSQAIRFADHGLSMPSFGLFATEARIAARREPIARFTSIVAATWQYIYNGHEDEAVEALIAQRPQARLDKAVLRGQLQALRGFFQLPPPAGQRLGTPVASDFSAAVKTLTDAGLLKSIKDGNAFFVPDLVRPAPEVPK